MGNDVLAVTGYRGFFQGFKEIIDWKKEAVVRESWNDWELQDVWGYVWFEEFEECCFLRYLLRVLLIW